jgi:hypothetical protein
MSPAQLLKHFGTKVAIAAAAGVQRQHVQGWFDRKSVPIEQQIKLEVASGGILKADVSDEFREIVRSAAA